MKELQEVTGAPLPDIFVPIPKELTGHGTDAIRSETAEGARMLDVGVAYDKEAERMRMAGPRTSSLIMEPPPLRPWVDRGPLTSFADGPLDPSPERITPSAIHGTFRVARDGSIKRGMHVPRMVNYMRTEPYVTIDHVHAARAT